MMSLYDIGYWTGLALTAPVWLVLPRTRRKVIRWLREKRGDVPPREGDAPAVLIHAVSVGELNATKALVTLLQRTRPELQIVITTTTETGRAQGEQLYTNWPGVTVAWFPNDFSRSINRLLDNLRPDAVALMELEVWPNFVRVCEKRNIPVVLINGRMTEPSFQKYKWIKPVASRMFRRLAMVCAQDETYAERFKALGAPADRVVVTGTMKFDTAQVTDRIYGADSLAAATGLAPGRERIWVCGSTGPGEEEIVLRVYRRLLTRFARLRLVIVPRKPERFDEVAELIEKSKFRVIRRSRAAARQGDYAIPPVVLVDTMGELRHFYGLADVVFVGRTLVDLGPKLHGSDMIEPAALGKAVIVGPYTGNFAEAMRKFIAGDAIMTVKNEADLEQSVSVLLSTPAEALAMGRRAQAVVRVNQGATARHGNAILRALHTRQTAEEQGAGVRVQIENVYEAAGLSAEQPAEARSVPARPGHPAHLPVPDDPKITGLIFRRVEGMQDAEGIYRVQLASMEYDRVDPLSPNEQVPSLEDVARWIDDYVRFGRPQNFIVGEYLGEIVGYIHFIAAWGRTDGTHVYLYSGKVAPSWRNRGVEAALLGWAEERARQMAASFPPAGHPAHGFNVSSTEREMLEVLGNNGYRAATTTIEWGVSNLGLAQPIPLPPGYHFRPVITEYVPKMFAAMKLAYPGKTFADEDYRAFSDRVNRAPELCHAVWHGETPVGQILTELRQGRGLITEVNVVPEHRDKGLARALLARVIVDLRNRGARTVRMSSRIEKNYTSVRLFESVGMVPVKYFHEMQKPMEH